MGQHGTPGSVEDQLARQTPFAPFMTSIRASLLFKMPDQAPHIHKGPFLHGEPALTRLLARSVLSDQPTNMPRNHMARHDT